MHNMNPSYIRFLLFALLAGFMALLLYNQRKLVHEVAVLRREVHNQRHTTSELRRPPPTKSQKTIISRPLVSAPAAAALPLAPPPSRQPALVPTPHPRGGLEDLAQEYGQMRKDLDKLGKRILETARKLELTPEILQNLEIFQNPEDAPVQFRPFFAHYKNWKSRLRILRTIEARLRAEGIDFQLYRPSQTEEPFR